jgi:hypothetical protein
MSNSTDIVAYGNIIAKLPQDFCDKHPALILGSGILVIALPAICCGAKYLIEEVGGDFRYWVDAKYGKPPAVTVENSTPVLSNEQTVG